MPVIVGTARKDGSVQMKPVWFEYHDGQIWLNGGPKRRWVQRARRTGRLALFFIDPKNMWRLALIHCRLVETTTDGADEHIDLLSQRYLGVPYRNPKIERLTQVPHTSRRFACRSALALSPDAGTLAVVSDQGAGTYEAWTLAATGGTPSRAVGVPEHAVRSLCWSASGELIAAADRGGTELHQLYIRHPDGPSAPLSVDPAGKVQRLLSWNATSPDGRRVATDMDIVIADLASREERAVLTGPAWHVVGGWSPDGNALLVMRVLDNTTQDLLIVDPRTGAAQQITEPREQVQHVPAGWLADGRALEITDVDSEHLWLAALDTRSWKREAIDRPEWDVELAASSADGRT